MYNCSEKNTVICCINCVALSFHTHFYSCIFHPLPFLIVSCRYFHSRIFHSCIFSPPLRSTLCVFRVGHRCRPLVSAGKVSAAEVTNRKRDNFGSTVTDFKGSQFAWAAMEKKWSIPDRLDIRNFIHVYVFTVTSMICGICSGVIIMRPSSLGGGRILRCTLSVRPSVRLSVHPVSGCSLFTVAPSYERTSKIKKKLRFSLMGQRHVCTFRHARRGPHIVRPSRPHKFLC